jgi:putative ABC transport system ATP-binding protein
MSETLLNIRNLERHHGEGDERRKILRGISFSMNRGEFLCIMGPSGSGKTTLLHLVSGLDQPSSGSIELAGIDLAKLNRRRQTQHRRDTVAHVFQFFNLLPNLSVRENITLPLVIRGEDPARKADQVNALLERLGLEDRAEALPHQLSGGEMQRCSLARALAGEQALLLCDEPTGNLSQKAGLEVMESLRALPEKDGRGLLLVTHNPRDATFADRVLFLVDGALSRDVELKGPGIQVDEVHQALATLAI